MAPLNKRRTWTVGECTITCESRIFTLVMGDAEREPSAPPAPAHAAKSVRPRRRPAQRAD